MFVTSFICHYYFCCGCRIHSFLVSVSLCFAPSRLRYFARSPSVACILVFLSTKAATTILLLCCLLFALLHLSTSPPPALLSFSCWCCVVVVLLFLLLLLLQILLWLVAATAVVRCSLLMAKVFCAVALQHDYDCISSCHYYLLFSLQLMPRSLFISADSSCALNLIYAKSIYNLIQ